MIRSLPALVLPFLLFGCAYGYAGQEARQRTEPETKTNVRVVEVKEAEPVPAESPASVEPPAPVESPCGVPTFEIHFYAEGSQTTKTVDCVSRTVINVARTPMGETSYVSARAAGLPEGSWYILVDPKGVRSDQLNNAALLKLSREFTIDYFGRDAERDLLVYLYNDEPR